MTDTAQTIASTALQTAVTLAPALAAADPKVAAVVTLAPIAIQFLQSAFQLQEAGVISPIQLANLFGSVGAGVQSTHDQWHAMNIADAAANQA